MKAIQISGLRQMQIVSVPEQELHADEVLLRLEYVLSMSASAVLTLVLI